MFNTDQRDSDQRTGAGRDACPRERLTAWRPQLKHMKDFFCWFLWRSRLFACTSHVSSVKFTWGLVCTSVASHTSQNVSFTKDRFWERDSPESTSWAMMCHRETLVILCGKNKQTNQITNQACKLLICVHVTSNKTTHKSAHGPKWSRLQPSF